MAYDGSTLRLRRRRHSLIHPEASSDDTSSDDDKMHDRRIPVACVEAGGSKEECFSAATAAMLGLLGFVYTMSFLAALRQNRALIGSRGLWPAREHFEVLRHASEGSPLDGFKKHPAVWWWVPLTDANLDYVYVWGMVLGASTCLGLHSSLALAGLWTLHFSVVTAASGSSFYRYGWESQLLETGFLAIFLTSLRPWRFFREDHTPSAVVLWLMRWLCFRISLGAGMIKLRGGSCWAEKTCLHYHFETQPVPSPLSFFFHFLPRPVLTHAVDLDLFVQVYTSWLVLLPGLNAPMRWLRRAGGLLQIGFMLNIMAAGNYGTLNHLTIIPALACLDDACWPRWMRLAPQPRARPAAAASYGRLPRSLSQLARSLVDAALLAAVAVLSWPVVANLLQIGGERQVMNASYNAWRLVNTYGAFGSVGKGRYEPIISVSHDRNHWHELDFPCKPGNLSRAPCFSGLIAYHHRLDWNIWFIGFKPHHHWLNTREVWLYSFLAKLLVGHHGALGLMHPSAAKGPGFMRKVEKRRGAKPRHVAPKYAKVEMYHYQMAAPLHTILAQRVRRWWYGSRAGPAPVWWTRTYEAELIPPVMFDQPTGQLVHAEGGTPVGH